MPVEWISEIDPGALIWISLGTIVILLCYCPGQHLLWNSFARQTNNLSTEALVPLIVVLSTTWFCWSFSLSFAPSWGTVPPSDSAAAPPVPTDLRIALKIEEARPDLTSSIGRGGVVGGLDYGLLQGLLPSGDQTRMSFPVQPPYWHVPISFLLVYHWAISLGFTLVACSLIMNRWPLRAIIIGAVCWQSLVYAPIAHWTWGQGWFMHRGGMDSGGALLHLATACTLLTTLWLMNRWNSIRPLKDDLPPFTPAHPASHEQPPDTRMSVGALLFLSGCLIVNQTPWLEPAWPSMSLWLNTLIIATVTSLTAAATAYWLGLVPVVNPWSAGLFAGAVASSGGTHALAPHSAAILGAILGVATTIVCIRYSRVDQRDGGTLSAMLWVYAVASVLGLLFSATFAMSILIGQETETTTLSGWIETGDPRLLWLHLAGILAAGVLATTVTLLTVGFIQKFATTAQTPIPAKTDRLA